MNIGVINETLRLTDGFSASFRTFIDLGNKAVQSTYMLDQNLSRAMGKSAGATIGAIRQLGNQLEQQNQTLLEIVNNQKRQTEETEKTNNSSKKWLSTIRGIAAATGATALVKSFLETSDTMSQIDAKLNNMVASESELVSLQNQIYQSAQRSRAAYTDTANLIARLGSNAKDTFNSNAELIQFAENLNKSFAIAGASQQEQSAATLQLTQALASGVLRGDELNSVFEQAPGLIQNIANYIENNNDLLSQMAKILNIKPDELSGNVKKYIRDIASEGALSADIVKNAILSATDEINTQFEAMPMTLAQAFTMGKNSIQNALRGSFEGWSDFMNSDEGQQAMTRIINLFTLMAQVGAGALSAIGQGALFVANNLDFILPVLAAIGVAYAFMHAQAIASAAAQVGGALASAAAWAVANWPILLLIALLAAALIATQKMGIGMQEVGGVVGQVLGTIYAVAYNVFAAIWNVIAAFAEFFVNVWDHPLVAIANLFFDVFDVILGIVETVAGAIDTLLGTNMASAVSGFRNKMSGWVDDTFGENAIQIKRMSNLNVSETAAKWGQTGSNIGSKLDNMNLSLDSIAGGISGLSSAAIPSADELNVGDVGTVGKVKSVEGDVSLADEDLKLYRDLAERRYMTNVELQTLAPQISITVPDGSAKNFDIKELEAMLKALLIQQAAAHTAVSHS